MDALCCSGWGPKFWAAEGGVAPARAGWIETWKAAAGGPCGRDYAAALSLGGGDCPRGVPMLIREQLVTWARVRKRAAPHSRRPARRAGAWAARIRQRPPRSAAAHGRLRALGLGMRRRPMACRHLRPRLCGKPPSGDRNHHRGRPDRHLLAHHHGRSDHVDGERFRPYASVRAKCS